MKFPLFFGRERSTAAARARQDRFERAIADGLRVFGQLCTKLADAVETQRLTRSGYKDQERFLERTDLKKD